MYGILSIVYYRKDAEQYSAIIEFYLLPYLVNTLFNQSYLIT